MTNQLKTMLLLGALSVLLIGVGGTLGAGYLYVFLPRISDTEHRGSS